eukprot:COSAG06_NODE_1087_length_10749_cov_1130.191174_7_plen_60_part_00
MIFLPRQARDKHRENSKTDRFLVGDHDAPLALPGMRKRVFFAPFYTKNAHFTKTGSGQT